MNEFADQNNPELNRGDHIGGYEIKRVAALENSRSFFYELEHAATGARHIHISNKDAENTFGVVFKTVPADSTGVAHILEHTALCGSAKFPVRDPFFSMLKRTLSTFMNALTASDWTMYPFSTQNRKDFYNLMDVYLDAAFFPKLNLLNFKQEGHRMEIGDDGNLVYKGVVYNEMKGAMSSPDQIMGRSLLNALYPSTTYSNNSGGDPKIIPGLTHGQLLEFHKRHYHPSNAFFYTYGNLPLNEHLRFIEDKILRHFERIDPKTLVPSQPRWKEPKTVRYSYPLAETEDPSKKFQACVAWLTSDIRDSFEVLVLTLLEHVLIGNPASPLRKALMDSELGTALADGTGFDPDIMDTMFACGLKGVEETAAEKIEAIIFDVLRELADKGIDRKLIDSAIHQVEFHRKEITNTPYPYGIKLLLYICGAWIHGGDPIKVLQFDDDLERLHQELAKGPLFENRIKTCFLDNPHRVLFKLVPDQQMEHREAGQVREELARIMTKMSPSELEHIQTDADALEKLQEAAENLSVLPTLQIGDIPPSVQIMPATRNLDPGDRCRFPVSIYHQPTSGIFYFSGAMGAGNLSPELIPLASFFCFALTRIGTEKRDYTEIVQMIDACTGGIGLSPSARNDFGEKGGCLPFTAINGKCLVRNRDRMFDIIRELLCEFSFSDLPRLRSLLLEYRAGMESGIVNNGHGLAISLAARNFSLSRSLHEKWGGVHQIRMIKDISDNLTDEQLQKMGERLTNLGKSLFAEDNFKAAMIGEEAALAGAEERIAGLLADSQTLIPESGFLAPKMELGSDIPREGWGTSTAVSFVAQAFETVRMKHEDSPVLVVIAKIIRSLYLHREIREKGGAYGGFAMYNPEDGIFCFGSYRDPHIVSTLNVYDRAGDFIMSGKFSEGDIREAILMVCSDIDKPDPPGPSARKAFYRKIVSLSDEARKDFKKRLLSVNRRQVMAAAQKYFSSGVKNRGVAVVSSEEKLRAANEKLSDNPLRLHTI
ncbi:MAG: peptidase M16 [Desulfobacteraceae bacterium 4572_88]|nr:MAG: peptidase M16 [Desulfobacteraceae bacterium 4572_88]